MTTLSLLAFLALDGYTDALLWPRLRKRGWGSATYQLVRFAVIRLPLLVGVYALSGALGVLLSLVLIWAAPMDTLYHAFGAEGWRGKGLFGIPITRRDHDHKGPILPAIASDLIGKGRMTEVEYRTASVAAGLAILLCAACIDAVLILVLA